MIISLSATSVPPPPYIKCYFNTSYFSDERLITSCIASKGTLLSPPLRAMISLGQQITWLKNWSTPVEHWTGGASCWTDSCDSIKIHFWRMHVILVFVLWAHFWSFPLFLWLRRWPQEYCVVLLAVGFLFSEMFSVKPLSCSLAFSTSLPPCPSRLAPSLCKKTQGNWQAAGQGKLSYIISPSGAFLCCLYLKAIIFYISWQEFSSTSDP